MEGRDIGGGEKQGEKGRRVDDQKQKKTKKNKKKTKQKESGIGEKKRNLTNKAAEQRDN